MVMTYLSQEGVQRAARYKYIGRDKSLIYAHIGSPLAQWCVDHLLPTWMAPNLVRAVHLQSVTAGSQAPFPHPHTPGDAAGLGAVAHHFLRLCRAEPKPNGGWSAFPHLHSGCCDTDSVLGG